MEKIKNMTNDPQLLMYEIRKRRKDFIFWCLAIIIVLIIFLFICRKEISVLQTLSSITKTLSFIIILLKVINNQSCIGLSANSLICFFISLLCRKFVVTFFAIRLRNYKVDAINTTFSSVSEFLSFFIICFLLYAIYFKYKLTADFKDDQSMPFYFLCIPAFLCAIPFKPWVYRNLFADLIWIYSIFLDSISIYPQIILFSKKRKTIESFTSHYLALQGLSSIFGIIYWIKSYYLFNDRWSLLLGEYSGYLIVVSETVKLFIMGYFFYLYLQGLNDIKKRKKYDI